MPPRQASGERRSRGRAAAADGAVLSIWSARPSCRRGSIPRTWAQVIRAYQDCCAEVVEALGRPRRQIHGRRRARLFRLAAGARGRGRAGGAGRAGAGRGGERPRRARVGLGRRARKTAARGAGRHRDRSGHGRRADRRGRGAGADGGRRDAEPGGAAPGARRAGQRRDQPGDAAAGRRAVRARRLGPRASRASPSRSPLPGRGRGPRRGPLRGAARRAPHAAGRARARARRSCWSAGPGPRTATARWSCSRASRASASRACCERCARSLAASRTSRSATSARPTTPTAHSIRSSTQLERAARLRASTTRRRPSSPSWRRCSRQATEQLDEAVPLIAALLGVPTGERYPALNLTPAAPEAAHARGPARAAGRPRPRRPVLVLYEDVHWVDPSTLELLDLVVERVRSLPVLVLLTYRPEFQPPWTGQRPRHLAAAQPPRPAPGGAIWSSASPAARRCRPRSSSRSWRAPTACRCSSRS